MVRKTIFIDKHYIKEQLLVLLLKGLWHIHTSLAYSKFLVYELCYCTKNKVKFPQAKMKRLLCLCFFVCWYLFICFIYLALSLQFSSEHDSRYTYSMQLVSYVYIKLVSFVRTWFLAAFLFQTIRTHDISTSWIQNIKK